MADTALGELRRPTRPLEERLERIARWRAQGLDTGESDATFPADGTDGDAFVAGGADSAAGAEAGAVTPSWLFDGFDLAAATANSFTLTGYPLENSEVVRVNGLVLEPTTEYTITGNVLELVDIDAVRLGIGADSWRIVVSYAYFDRTVPSFDPPATITGWTLNGSATAVGDYVQLTDATTGDQAGSMVTSEVIPTGWSFITIDIALEYTPGVGPGDGFVFGLLDSTVHDDTFLGGYGGDMGFAPLSGKVYAVGWVDTFSAGAGVAIASRDAADNNTEDGDPGGYVSTGVNTYSLAFTATTPGRASATLSWNGTPVEASTTDVYVPASPRVVLTAGTGAAKQDVTIQSVEIETDGSGDSAIAAPEGSYVPPTPPATPGTTDLSWAPLASTGWEEQEIDASGGTFTLDHRADWLITCTEVVDEPVTIIGGRNINLIGMIRDFPTTIPTGSYDAERRGLRFKDGPNPDLKRVIHCEGLYGRTGYYSDLLQLSFRYENAVTFILQALRADASGWGRRSGVHSDVVQFYGGPLNFFADSITAKLLTYQGIFMRPLDGRPAPSGEDKLPWDMRRVNLEGSDATDGARYLLYDVSPTFTDLVLDEVYTIGEGYDQTDSTGNMPATGLFQNATPAGGDFAPASWWSGDVYTSPGYV